MIRHGEFADVMKQCAGPQGAYVAFIKTHDRSQSDGVDLRASDMPHPDLVACVYRGGQSFNSSEMHPARFADQSSLLFESSSMDGIRRTGYDAGREYYEYERGAEIINRGCYDHKGHTGNRKEAPLNQFYPKAA